MNREYKYYRMFYIGSEARIGRIYNNRCWAYHKDSKKWYEQNVPSAIILPLRHWVSISEKEAFIEIL